MKVNEQEKLRASATIFCRDAAGAAEVKKVVDAVLVELEAKLKDHPERKAMLKFHPELAPLDGLARVSVQGNQVSIEMTTDAASAVRYFMLSLSKEKKEPQK